MKKLSSFIIIASIAFTVVSCENKARYIDLNTGKEVELVKDETSGLMVNKETKQPVEIYVDTKNNDTIYGKTGKVINGEVRKSDGNVYVWSGAYEYKNGDMKVEVEKDGDIKIKDGDSKIKIDGETGEKKVKKDD
jgi:hypothetical protein